jgi:Rho guanine nucleotide exchange factor 7
MESQGAASPGLLVLTTGLSKPFRRLEKYAGMLQELERHVEENHPDRGDTQRSVSVYKDIAVSILLFYSNSSIRLHETSLWHSSYSKVS